MQIEAVHRHIDTMQQQDLETLMQVVRQPSVSAQDLGIRQCGKLLVELLEGIGVSARLIETEGEPVVYGERMCGNPDAKTILFYGHYDTQPAEPLDDWNTDPFEPVVKDGRIWGRGTADNKGQFLPHFFAVRSYLAVHGDLPVHVKFVLDGEEESGSPSMRGFVESHKEMLKADLVYFADGPANANDQPELMHGFRGMYSCHMILETAAHENHSGKTGLLIPNPITEMMRLITTMIDPTGHITIDGFYDDVVAPTDFEWDLIDKIDYSPEKFAKTFGVDHIPYDKREYYYRFMFQPTLTISTLMGGYMGKGSKTSVPNRAELKFDMRLAWDQDPYDIEKKVKAHVAKFNPDIVVNTINRTPSSKTPVDLPVCKAVAEAASKYFDCVLIPTAGATCPDYVWTRILHTPSILMPYGNRDQDNHAANENLKLENFYKGIHTSAEVIHCVSKIK